MYNMLYRLVTTLYVVCLVTCQVTANHQCVDGEELEHTFNENSAEISIVVDGRAALGLLDGSTQTFSLDNTSLVNIGLSGGGSLVTSVSLSTQNAEQITLTCYDSEGTVLSADTAVIADTSTPITTDFDSSVSGVSSISISVIVSVSASECEAGGLVITTCKAVISPCDEDNIVDYTFEEAEEELFYVSVFGPSDTGFGSLDANDMIDGSGKSIQLQKQGENDTDEILIEFDEPVNLIDLRISTEGAEVVTVKMSNENNEPFFVDSKAVTTDLHEYTFSDETSLLMSVQSISIHFTYTLDNLITVSGLRMTICDPSRNTPAPPSPPSPSTPNPPPPPPPPSSPTGPPHCHGVAGVVNHDNHQEFGVTLAVIGPHNDMFPDSHIWLGGPSGKPPLFFNGDGEAKIRIQFDKPTNLVQIGMDSQRADFVMLAAFGINDQLLYSAKSDVPANILSGGPRTRFSHTFFQVDLLMGVSYIVLSFGFGDSLEINIKDVEIDICTLLMTHDIVDLSKLNTLYKGQLMVDWMYLNVAEYV